MFITLYLICGIKQNKTNAYTYKYTDILTHRESAWSEFVLQTGDAYIISGSVIQISVVALPVHILLGNKNYTGAL